MCLDQILIFDLLRNCFINIVLSSKSIFHGSWQKQGELKPIHIHFVRAISVHGLYLYRTLNASRNRSNVCKYMHIISSLLAQTPKYTNAVPLMTFMARLAPDLRDRDTVCLNSYCSLNSPARWDIFGKLLTKLLNFSEQSITHGSVTLKPM